MERNEHAFAKRSELQEAQPAPRHRCVVGERSLANDVIE
jgi:hypothetical protein